MERQKKGISMRRQCTMLVWGESNQLNLILDDTMSYKYKCYVAMLLKNMHL